MNRYVKQRAGWAERVAVCIASGPSLSDEQLAAVRAAREADDVRVIGVNNTYQRAPWIDAVLAVDLLWWKKHISAVRASGTTAELVTPDSNAEKAFHITRVRGSAADGLGLHELHIGGNGGHAALNLAYLWGARRILLLGYDMKLGPAGQRHWHADHPAPLIQDQLFAHWIKRFDSTARDLHRLGALVINCTPGSALHHFPHFDLQTGLDLLTAHEAA